MHRHQRPQVPHLSGYIYATQRPIGVTEVPSPAKLAAAVKEPVYEYGHERRARQKVDSKSDKKGEGKSRSEDVQPPAYIGTTYRHTKNSANMRTSSVPTNPAIPVPYVASSKHQFDGTRLLTNRTAGGEILGTTSRHYVDICNVPQTKVEDLSAALNDSVGPDNPIKPINDTWSECWDAEVGAIYYYNKLSGEATWVAPDELQAYLEKKKFAAKA
jgi:hypothetical protein